MTTTFALLPPRPDLSGARLRLFETAVILFGDKGYHGVSVRDLATELGQQPGALYFHVASKQQLLFELVQIGFQAHGEALRDALLSTGADPVEQVRAITYANVLFHLTYRQLALVVHRERRSLTDEQRSAIAALGGETERTFHEVIDRGLRLGVLTTADPYLAVKAIGATAIRAAEWWTPTSPSAEHIATTYADFAVKLLT